jgi:hypothetical protein
MDIRNSNAVTSHNLILNLFCLKDRASSISCKMENKDDVIIIQTGVLSN